MGRICELARQVAFHTAERQISYLMLFQDKLLVSGCLWTQEFPGWLDNFLQQEFHDLDGQVPPKLMCFFAIGCVIGYSSKERYSRFLRYSPFTNLVQLFLVLPIHGLRCPG